MVPKTVIPKSQRYGVNLIKCIKNILEKKISVDEITLIYIVGFEKIDINNFINIFADAVNPRSGSYSRAQASTPVDRLRLYCNNASADVSLIMLFTGGDARREFKAYSWKKIFDVLKKLHKAKKIVQPEDSGPYCLPDDTFWVEDIHDYKEKPKIAA